MKIMDVMYIGGHRIDNYSVEIEMRIYASVFLKPED